VKAKLLALALLSLTLEGCLGGSPDRGTAQVGVYLTHTATTSPLTLHASAQEEIAEVWVNVTRVTARIDGKWVTLLQVPESEGALNLQGLRFKERLLGEKTIPAGKITEIRFELRKNEANGPLYNYVVLADGSQLALNVPSGELKPELDLVVAKDTVVELVFDVNLDYFVERGGDGSYNVNPRKALVFLESFRDRFASIRGEVELPNGLDQLISMEINLFRQGYDQPIWTAHLQDGRLSFEITSLPAGQYRLEASVEVLGAASLTLSSGPFYLEEGSSKSVTLRS